MIWYVLIQWYYISKGYAVFSRFKQTLTYSLALCRHVVCSWPAPLPLSASALSLAEVRKTVLMQNKLNHLGWIFFLSLSLPRNDLGTHHYFANVMCQESPRGPGEPEYVKKKTKTKQKNRCCDFPPSPSVLFSNSDHPDPEGLLLKMNPIYYYCSYSDTLNCVTNLHTLVYYCCYSCYKSFWQ